MEAVRQAWMLLAFQLLIHVTSAQVFEISRQTSGMDSFVIPPSMCGNPRYGCKSFYTVDQGPNCSCLCPTSNATFVFADNRWICMANTRARENFQAGCEAKTTFLGENSDGRIPTLVIGSRREISLMYWPWELWRCSFDFTSSWFVGCNGSKHLLTQQYLNATSSLFRLLPRNPLTARYVLEVATGVSDSTLLQGKIINLLLRCSADILPDFALDFCLMFKLEGKESCPVNEPTISNFSTIQPSKTTHPTPTTTSSMQNYTTITQPTSRVPPSVVTLLHANSTSMTSSYAPSESPSTTPTTSKASPNVSIRTLASTSDVFVASTIVLDATLTASTISSTASVSSPVSYPTTRPLVSPPQSILSEILSTTLVGSATTFSASTTASVNSLSDSVTSKIAFVTPTTVFGTSASTISDNLPTVSDASSTAFVSSPTVSVTAPTVSLTARSSSDSTPKVSLSSRTFSDNSVALSETSYVTTTESVSQLTVSSTPKVTSRASSSLSSAFDITPTPSESTAKPATPTTHASNVISTESISSQTFSSIRQRSSVSSWTASDVTPRASVSPSAVSSTKQRTSISSTTTSSATTRTSVSSWRISEILTSAAASSPKVLGSSPGVLLSQVIPSDTRMTKEISPTSLNILPTVKIPLEVIEVSSTINEGSETPIFLPPGIRGVTSEPDIPPSTGSRGTEKNNGLYMGLVIGTTAFAIAAVVIFGFLFYRRRRSNVEPRPRSASEETKISIMMSPRTSFAQEPEADETLRRSPMYVPNYQIPLWEDESEKDSIYAVLNIPEETNAEAGNDEEPFYYLLEEVAPNNKEMDDNNFSEDPSKPEPNKDPIYAKVIRKKQPVDTLIDMSELINSIENSGNWEGASEPVLGILGPYVEEGRPQASAENQVYFTLEECFSDTFRRSNNDLDSKNVPLYSILEGPDRYRAICTEALFYYTPNRSECEDQNNNNSKFTIEQVFDELEDRYLNRNEEPGTSSPEKPGLIHCSERQDESDDRSTNEPVFNVLEDLSLRGSPVAISHHGGPVYFNLKRLKSNHAKATRIRPRLEEALDDNVVDELYLKGTEGDDWTEEEPVFFTLEKLCSDTFKRESKDCAGTTIEQALAELEEHYLRGNEESGTSFPERASVAPEKHCLDQEQDTSASKDSNEEMQPPKYRARPIRKGPVYLTLNQLRANLSHSKATGIDSKLEDEQVNNTEEENYPEDAKENDQTGVLDEPIFFTLKKLCPDSLKRYRSDGQGTTIEQVFDQLEERYLKRNEEHGTTFPGRPNQPTEGHSLGAIDKSESEDTKEQMRNFLEEVCITTRPKCRARPLREGPVYLTLKPSGATQSKAAQTDSKLDDDDQSGVLDEPIYFTLKKLCPDSLKRYRSDGQGTTIEQVFDKLEERYLIRNEDAGTTSSERSSQQPEGQSLGKEREKSDSKDPKKAMQNVLEDVCTVNHPKYRAKPIREGPVYLTLNRLRDDISNSKAAGIGSKLEDEEVNNVEEENYPKDVKENDQTGALDEPIFFTLKKLCPDSLKRYRRDGQGTTIEQMFDQLEESYLKRNEEAGITSSERPSLQPERQFLDKEKDSSDTKESNEPLYSSLDEVRAVNPPKYRAKPIREGPVYLTLNRLRANISNSKATGIGSRLEDEQVNNVEEENYPNDAKENDQTGVLDEPIFFTLKKLCPDSLKRYRSDGQGTTIEQVFDELEERYLQRNEEAGITSSERPSLQPERQSLDKEKENSDSKESKEPMYSSLDELRTVNTPKYRAKPIREGPVYLTLNRLRANISNSKSAGTGSRLEDEQVSNAEEENYAKDAKENDHSGALDEAIFFTLKKLCPDSLKRYRSDGQGATIEQVFDQLEERYLNRDEEDGTTSPGRLNLPTEGHSLGTLDKSESEDTKEQMRNFLEDVCITNRPNFRARPIREGPVYLTLKQSEANQSKAAQTGSKSDDDDHSGALDEAIYFTLKRLCPDSLKRYKSDGQGTTIEQVFDHLEERYLKTNEEAGNTSSEGPSQPLDRHCPDEKDESGATGTNEPVYNMLHHVCLKGPPKYRAIPIQGGPIYFSLKRIKSNHSKAARMCSKWEDEPVYSVVGEEYLEGAKGTDQPEEPIYLTLEEFCSETLKRARNDGEDASRSVEDISKELKNGSKEETSPSENSGLTTSEEVYWKNLKKPETESRC